MNKPSPDIDPEIAGNLGLQQRASRGKRLLRWAALVIAVVAVIGGVVSWQSRTSAPAIQFKTQQVQRGDLVVTVTATGNLQPTNLVDVGIEVSGTVASVDVDFNDTVKRGETLARLDTSKLEAQVLRSKAALEAAQARVLQAQATEKDAQAELGRLEQVRKLSGGKVPSQRDLETAQAGLLRAQADLASARAAVAEAKATLDANETDLGKAVIRSPIDGIVLKRAVERGQTVAASFQAPVLFTLAEDLTKMELHVDVDEADVGLVQAGQAATFSVDAYPNRTFPARITQVRYASAEVQGVITYQTILDVDNADLSLRPGMTATADVTVKKVENAVLVPNAALRFTPPTTSAESESGRGLLEALLPRWRGRGGQQRESVPDGNRRQVWILKNGQPSSVEVAVGSTDGKMTEVLGGDLSPADKVIVDTVTRKRSS